MTKRLRTGIPAFAALIVLILDTKTALSGAAEGLELCLRTVIPTLFPFIVITSVLTSSLSGFALPILRPVRRLCRIPVGSESLLLTGFLGGYPVGAQCVAQAWKDKQLSRQDAQRMLGFCSNAGPAFLFGIVAGKFSDLSAACILFVIHIVSALIVASILPGGSYDSVQLPCKSSLTLTEAVSRGVKTVSVICGWILLFRVMIAFLNRWILWILPTEIKVILVGVLDLSNGCCELGNITSPGLRFISASGMLAFGGICVSMQTVSVCGGLKLGFYFTGKVLQCLISIVLSGLWQALFFTAKEQYFLNPVFFPIMLLFISGYILILYRNKKRSSIPAIIGV